jgi:hypothetical protein
MRTMGSGATLLALAAQLRLTAKQRAFAEHLAADPDRIATRAARAAGAGKGAEVTASKWLRLAKVQTYLGALTVEAQTSAAARTSGAVVSLTEILERLTAIARTSIGDCLRISSSGRLEIDPETVMNAPPGAVEVRRRRNAKQDAWTIKSNAGMAMRALLQYHIYSLGRGSKR